MSEKAIGSREEIPPYRSAPQRMRFPPVLELHRLRSRQWQLQEAILESQRPKLLKTVSRAYTDVEYYKDIMSKAALTPDQIKETRDLSIMPISDRRIFQTRPLREVTRSNTNLENCRRILTSGSTGRPLMVYRDRREDNLIDMVWAFAFMENGQRLRDKCADFHSYRKAHARWFERIGIWRRVTIPTLADPTEQVELLARNKPSIIRGNPGDLLNLASTIKRKGVRGFNPRLIFTMGSLLDGPSRAVIESAYGAEVFDYYGSTEFGCIAWECSEHKGYHINTDAVVVEILDEAGRPAMPGQPGKIVCTSLIACTMPFIRYYTGDVGVLDSGRCRCGRGLPLLSRIEGRTYDFFTLRDGRQISPWTILNRIKHIQGIQQYKIVQEDFSQIDIKIVPNEEWTPHGTQSVQAIIEEITRGTATVHVETVDAIPEDKPGKIQSITSKVTKTT